jgi:hypothetical protein
VEEKKITSTHCYLLEWNSIEKTCLEMETHVQELDEIAEDRMVTNRKMLAGIKQRYHLQAQECSCCSFTGISMVKTSSVCKISKALTCSNSNISHSPAIRVSLRGRSWASV